ncbi:MAG: dihydrolipoyl dehydrogenase family protein [Acidimicrobiales bacterium]
MDYDLLVIGGGAGGLGAARAAARRRARVALVHHGPIGGECTFTGCVPSKALIEAAARGATFHEAMAAAHRAIEAIAATETREALAREGIEAVPGWARFLSPSTVDVDGRALHARRVVVATGAGPALPPVPGLGGIRCLTNETVFALEALPASLVVLGGGPVGAELAQAFARLGARVTVVEALDRLLPREEPEASAVVAQAFSSEGIDVRLGSPVAGVDPLTGVDPLAGLDPLAGAGPAARLHLGDGTSVDAGSVLVATGRSPRTDGLGLEEAGVELDQRGFIVTDDHMATTARGIWAVGDVAGRLQLTHAADEMGRVAVANAFAPLPYRRFRADRVPWVTFTSPEVARVGLTEAEAAGLGARVAEVPMAEVDRAVAAGDTRGFCKLVVGPRKLLGNLAGGRVLGATVVAARGGEVVHEAALAMRAHLFPAQLALTTHAYPTWSMAIQQAASQCFIGVGGRRARPARPDRPPARPDRPPAPRQPARGQPPAPRAAAGSRPASGPGGGRPPAGPGRGRPPRAPGAGRP